MDTRTTIAIVAPAAATIIGVWLGWLLSRKTTREVADETRRWQEDQRIRERQETFAGTLREELIEVQEVVPRGVKTRAEAAEPLFDAHLRVRKAWTRASLLRNDGIDRCFNAFDMTLYIASQDTRGHRDREINYWPIDVALIELRQALDAYLRHETLPDPRFPTVKELIQIAHAGGKDLGIDGIREYLIAHNIGLGV